MVARERRRHLDAPVRLDAIELRFVATARAPDSPVQPVAGLYRAVPACYMVAVFFQEILKFRFHFSLILCKFHIMVWGVGLGMGLVWLVVSIRKSDCGDTGIGKINSGKHNNYTA